jgi:hypothetical protein
MGPSKTPTETAPQASGDPRRRIGRQCLMEELTLPVPQPSPLMPPQTSWVASGPEVAAAASVDMSSAGHADVPEWSLVNFQREGGLGSGPVGKTHEATYRPTGERVVIRFITKSISGEMEEGLRSMVRFSHPCVARYHAFVPGGAGEKEQRHSPFLVRSHFGPERFGGNAAGSAPPVVPDPAGCGVWFGGGPE